MSDMPEMFKDAEQRLNENGFIQNNVWYHGTSSALVDSIKINGLKRSGDHEFKQARKKTMATIGNHYTETIEPVFLCPSKELAYFWAEQKVKERGLRFSANEKPVVIEINLPDDLQQSVRPDVGATSLLLLKEGEEYLIYIAKLAERVGVSLPEIDLKNADRMMFLNQLGLAYLDKDISAEYIKLL